MVNYKIAIPIQVIVSLFLFFVLSMDAHADIPEEVTEKAEQGDVNFQYSLARIYELGKRVKSDRDKAIFWYTKAADGGHVEASYRLGYMHYRTKAGKQDLATAFKYMKQAAEGNQKRAQTYLSQMYNKGLGVSKDTQRSNYWYTQSFNSNMQTYEQYLASINKKSVAEVPAPVAEPEPEPEPVKAREVATQNNRPVKEVIPDLATHLLSYKWYQDGKPAVFLKSATTNCEDKGEKISCTSDKLTGRDKTGIFKYKVRAIIEEAGDEHEFDISYRRMITAVPPPTIAAYDENASVSKPVETLSVGWEPHTHVIPCKVTGLKSVLCRPVGEDAFYMKAR